MRNKIEVLLIQLGKERIQLERKYLPSVLEYSCQYKIVLAKIEMLTFLYND